MGSILILPIIIFQRNNIAIAISDNFGTCCNIHLPISFLLDTQNTRDNIVGLIINAGYLLCSPHLLLFIRFYLYIPLDTYVDLLGVAATIVILDIVLWMVRIVDACQTVVVVGIGYHLSFLSHVRGLLGKHVAERIVGERGDSACGMVDLRAAVAHVVNRCGDWNSPDTLKQGNMVCDTSFHTQS